MKTRILYLFLISNVTLSSVFSQREKSNVPFYKEAKRDALFVGIDAGKVGYSLFDNNYSLFEMSFSYRIKDKLFPTLEIGRADYIFEELNSNYNSYSDGIYGKIGLDINLYKKTSDVIAFASRIGYSTYSYTAENIKISDIYWGIYSPEVSKQKNSAMWMEIGFSSKVEMVKNLYFGFLFSLKILLNTLNESTYEPYKIPGLGRPDVSVNIGFNYNIYYAFGIGKKRTKADGE